MSYPYEIAKGQKFCSLKNLSSTFMLADLVGDNTGRVTPVPIPNTVVKPSKADGT